MIAFIKENSMGRFGLSKRELLRGAAMLPLAGLGGNALAQDGALLGLPLPKEILNIIPRKP